MRILFDDDAVALTLSTPDGNRAIFSDRGGAITLEHGGGSRIVLDDAGITLDSSSDLTLKASGDIRIEGRNLDLAGQAQTKVSGSAGARLESSGQTVIKGSIVTIN